MLADRSPAIVVGVDGAEGSVAALSWAVTEAAVHGAPLRIVHVLDPRARRAPYARPHAEIVDLTDRTAVAEELIDRAVVQAHAPDGVRRVFEIGNPAEVLLRAAEGARMLVLGHTPRRPRRDGESHHDGPALGPTARACVTRATCPVVVVPVPQRLLDAIVLEQTPAAATEAPTPVEGARTLYPHYRATPVRR